MNLVDALYQLVRRAVADELDNRVLLAPGVAAEPDLEKLTDAARRFSLSVSFLEARVKGGELALYGRGHLRRVRPSEIREMLRRRNAPSPTDPSTRAEKILRSLPGGKTR